MGTVKRISRKKNNIFKYDANAVCKEAEGTILSDWMLYWENKDRIEPDVTVCLEDGCYQIHSCVLRFWSAYFDKLLVNHNPNSIVMLNEKQCYFECVRQFMYHGVLPLDNTNFLKILSIANDLEISSIVKFCSHWIISGLRDNIFNIAEVLEFLCEPKNQYSSKLIIPQLVRRWDIIQSGEFLKNISFEALKIIITSNALPRLDDNAVLDVCCRWIDLDIKRRSCFILKILQCVTGKSNDPYLLNVDPKCLEPKNIIDIKNVFNVLLEFSIKKEKIDFVNSFGLMIKKKNGQANDDVKDEPIPPTQQLFFFQQWSNHMKALRHKLSGDNIVVQVKSSQEYLLDYWILSLSSEFFQDLDPNFRHSVQLDLTDEEFTSVLDFMYGKELHITQHNIVNLLKASRYLKMYSCKQLVLRFIRKNISSLNMLDLLNDSYGQFDDIYKLVKRQIVKNFADIKKYSIFCLKYDCLKALVSSKTLKLDMNGKLNLCYDWVTHDIKKRYLFVPELITAICFLHCYNVEAVINKFNLQLRKKYFSDLFSFHDHEELQFGRTFKISVPRIDFAPYKTTKVLQKKTHFCRPFSIVIPRLKI